jgi:hypothetical protein
MGVKVTQVPAVADDAGVATTVMPEQGLGWVIL